MKLRTDFITNSSSSSFIFEKGIDLSEFKQRAIEKHKVVYERSQYKDYYRYEDDVVEQWLKKEPKELSQWSAEGKQKLF